MTTIEKYRRAIEIANNAKAQIIKELKEELSNIPDNPGIKRIASDTLNGFVISTSSLSSESWLPQYYDNKKIVSDICSHIKESQSLEQVGKYLKEVVDTRKVNGYRINEVCAEKIQQIMERNGL